MQLSQKRWAAGATRGAVRALPAPPRPPTPLIVILMRNCHRSVTARAAGARAGPAPVVKVRAIEGWVPGRGGARLAARVASGPLSGFMEALATLHRPAQGPEGPGAPTRAPRPARGARPGCTPDPPPLPVRHAPSRAAPQCGGQRQQVPEGPLARDRRRPGRVGRPGSRHERGGVARRGQCHARLLRAHDAAFTVLRPF